MNGLNKIDRELVDQLRSKIQTISGLQRTDELSQKDFDFLIFYIQEKTGHNLSLSTIKRIWRGDFQRLPRVSTLNMLSQLAFGQDWLALKKTYLENHKSDEMSAEPVVAPASPATKTSKGILPIMIICVLVLIGLGSFWYYASNQSTASNTDVVFSAKETVDAEVPNTVVFTYDVTSLNAEHFFIQQSWDEAKKIEVSKSNSTQTDIYYEPGYHYAKLFANEEIIKEIPVHVRFSDWFVRFRYPGARITRIEERHLIRNGYLGISKQYLAAHPENLTDNYSLGYMLSKDFNTSADAFTFSSSFKFDSLSAPACPIMSLLIKGDRDYMFLSLGKKGCESNLSFRCSDTHVSGKTNDLSSFGTDIFNWQGLTITVGDQKVKITLNRSAILETTYTKELGSIKEIDFFFNGIGSIDDIKLESKAGGLALAQKFE